MSDKKENPAEFYKHWEKSPSWIENVSKEKHIPILHRHFNEEEFLIFNTHILPEIGQSHGFYLSCEISDDSAQNHFKYKLCLIGFLGREAEFPCDLGILIERHILSRRGARFPLKSIGKQNEYNRIKDVLNSVNYNQSAAAKILNIDRKTLYNKLKKWEAKLSEINS